ncbi:FCD domain-containing protein [Actinomadura sp. LD22]|uniref:FCD domain-containing protein n=1 Tax=Actinomadura physcomitrii TaxID=2650748 RepID=A0A6I4MAU4_9ACTN|nr:GntR family transcriptional regulator [Actinomadura physcomitrii]MVZ99768.1 FCD domain-containing protein [Actinomadura physcomitrii]
MGELEQLAPTPTIGDRAYAAVREAIVSGTLERGAKVTERGLADMLNISPTPVREALRRLEQDRLVERVGPRSVRIARFDADELRRITAIEDALRALAARFAAEKATDGQLAELLGLLERAEQAAEQARAGDRSAVEGARQALRDFHSLIDRASGSATLIHMLNMVDAFNYEERRAVLLDQIEREPGAVARRFKQHRAIYEAIAAHDADRAEQLMREHSHAGNEPRLARRER